ncbi:MAG: hypothetical protein EPN60_10045 [Nevskiaceae bacterium]|nr:MAG: hypothetical protein EPN60_10045 [Nevskiaceae bacterium]
MRQFLAILLAISLSWVTTSYACQMDHQNLVRAFCCCKDKHTAKVGADAEKSQTSSAEKTSCCDVTSSASADQQQPAVASATFALDLPTLVPAPAVEWKIAAQVASFISLPPPARGPPAGTGTRTYLATSRLRL